MPCRPRAVRGQCVIPSPILQRAADSLPASGRLGSSRAKVCTGPVPPFSMPKGMLMCTESQLAHLWSSNRCPSWQHTGCRWRVHLNSLVSSPTSPFQSAKPVMILSPFHPTAVWTRRGVGDGTRDRQHRVHSCVPNENSKSCAEIPSAVLPPNTTIEWREALIAEGSQGCPSRRQSVTASTGVEHASYMHEDVGIGQSHGQVYSNCNGAYCTMHGTIVPGGYSTDTTTHECRG